VTPGDEIVDKVVNAYVVNIGIQTAIRWGRGEGLGECRLLRLFLPGSLNRMTGLVAEQKVPIISVPRTYLTRADALATMRNFPIALRKQGKIRIYCMDDGQSNTYPTLDSPTVGTTSGNSWLWLIAG
jgi:hypothetical protein